MDDTFSPGVYVYSKFVVVTKLDRMHLSLRAY